MVNKSNIGKTYYQGLYKSLENFQNDLEKDTDNVFTKALTFDTTNSGKEFIPEMWSADIITQIYETAFHRQYFRTLQMSSLKMNIPRFIKRWRSSYIGTSITSTDPSNQFPLQDTASSTDIKELELKTLVINLMIDDKEVAYNASDEFEEILREDMVSAVREDEIDAVINGDDSGTHMDSDVTDAKDVRKAFKGLRKLATASVDVGAALSKEAVSKMIKSLRRFGRNKSELLLIVSYDGEHQLRQVTDLTNMYQYGEGNAIRTGEIPKFYGVTVIVSDKMREDLNATGVFDNTTKTKTIALMVNTKYAYLGVPNSSNPKLKERQLKISKVEKDEFGYKQIVMVEDLAFNMAFDGAVCKAFNITVNA